MTKQQYIVLFSGISLFLVLYLGFDTQTKNQKSAIQSRQRTLERMDIGNLLNDAKDELSIVQGDEIAIYEQQLQNSDEGSKVEIWKKLSGLWYDFKQPAIAGYYAKLIAEQINDDESWAISGSTYVICTKMEEAVNLKSYCFENAVQSFENALSLNPDDLNSRLNLSMLYANNPPKENPMKGIQMLLALNKEYPDHLPTLLNLVKLGMQTGQFEKAANRLDRIFELDPENLEAACLAAEVFHQIGNNEKADLYSAKCKN